MSTVIIKKAAYEYHPLRQVIAEMMDVLCADLNFSGSRVLVKPNLLMPARPELAVLTHPMVVRAVCEYILAGGGRVQVSDSPATASLNRVLNVGGYKDAFKGMDVTFQSFVRLDKVDIGQPYGTIDIARDVLEADLIINLPKLKTHSGMLLTLGIKNLFGCVVGLQKPKWHLKCGDHPEIFAGLLTQIYRVVNPALTIVDGIMALEGQGPGTSGDPRHLGVLVGSRNTVAVDMAICSMLCLPFDKLPTLKAAAAMGFGNPSVDITGDFYMIDDYNFPEIGEEVFVRESLKRYMKRYLLRRPVADRKKCQLCGECWKICPVGVISQHPKTIRIDYNRCIRCYCCIEVCPHGAIRSIEPLPGKLFRKSQNIWNRARKRIPDKRAG